MKKVKLVSLVLIACYVVISAGTAMAENKIVYEKKVLLEGNRGSKPGEYGGNPDCDQTINCIVLDIGGNIYILDYPNNRVQKYNKDGKFLKIIPIKCTEVKKEQNYIIEDGKKLEHGYNLIATFNIRRVWVDKNGYIYAYESVNKECIKYDQEGNEKGRTKKGTGLDIYGKPYIFKDGKIAYIELDNSGLHIIGTKEIPAGVKTIKGNYYAEDFEKLNSYWIEDGENEKEKKIVVKNKDKEIIRELEILSEEKIDYIDLVHIDKHGSMEVSYGGNKFYYDAIYNLKGKILAESKEISDYNMVTIIKKDIPSFAWMEYIMDRDGNIYKLDSEDIPLTLTKWERKYIE